MRRTLPRWLKGVTEGGSAETGRPLLGPLVKTALGRVELVGEVKYFSRSAAICEFTSYFEEVVDFEGSDAIMGVPTRREDDRLVAAAVAVPRTREGREEDPAETVYSTRRNARAMEMEE
jgi:hypothetical protein